MSRVTSRVTEGLQDRGLHFIRDAVDEGLVRCRTTNKLLLIACAYTQVVRHLRAEKHLDKLKAEFERRAHTLGGDKDIVVLYLFAGNVRLRQARCEIGVNGGVSAVEQAHEVRRLQQRR